MSVIKEKLKLLHDNPVVAWHEHFWSTGDFRELDIKSADDSMRVFDLLGVDKIVTSLPVNTIKRCDPEIFISANNVTYEAVKRYPGRVYGMAYVHPGDIRAAVAEIERCVNELSFVGVKLYYDYFMDDPVYAPIIEKCIELDIPILQHSMHFMDAENRIRQPLATDGVHMANAARKYPEATFVMGHFTIAEWKYSLNAIADCPNVYTDMSGSVYDRPQMETAVKMLGADRILFGTDNSPSACVGKLLGARITEEDKKTILSGRAFERFLGRKGK
ncbi:MAG: amidohydrolase [Oscillospiraceae bacterium]|nr:amidohydrolase [Oscillospiraceae bacterium]